MGFLVKPIIDLGAPFLKNIGVGLKGMSSMQSMIELFIIHIFLGIHSLPNSTYHKIVILGQRRLCHVRVPFFIADEKDLACCVTATYASGQASRPCTVCETTFKDAITRQGSLRDLDWYRQV